MGHRLDHRDALFAHNPFEWFAGRALQLERLLENSGHGPRDCALRFDASDGGTASRP